MRITRFEKYGNNTEEARLTNICFPLKQKLAAVMLKVVAFSGQGH